MREIQAQEVSRTVADMCQQANYHLGRDMREALARARDREESPVGRDILDQLLQNASIAEAEHIPLCQDTGVAVFFVDLGQDVHISGGGLEEAINEGVRQGYSQGLLRKSMVAHPWRRKNTGDNTPAIIHLRLVPGDRLRLTFTAKGGGSENMSALRMLKPADGLEGVKNFVVETVAKAGPNACPPMVVGVGVGGNFETCALLAKKALLRPVGQPNADPELAQVEEELLQRANRLGVGPQGLGGRITVLAVQMEVYPCHIASLPVAVNIQCHANRHVVAEL
ncbi:MAG: fumarate hydratase [Firmicutes bacterium]|nr:fumarate hydratase [Bacillota bacterium]